jgi:diguanylate cyclase (GGDEF)-like protein/PAS domain S-box-containing protein
MSPILRISLGLVLMTMSFLLIGDLFGLLPNSDHIKMDARKKFCESIAVQFSAYAQTNDYTGIQFILDSLVDRDDDITSLALRNVDGRLLASAGDHTRYWIPRSDTKSTANQIQVPIKAGNRLWGTVEVLFKPIRKDGIAGIVGSSLFKLSIYFALAGFLGYFLFMKRALRELDPSKVVPARVKAAMDALSEGVLIIDDHKNIVLANKAFLRKSGESHKSLIGENIDRFAWSTDERGTPDDLPWMRTMMSGEHITDTPVTIRVESGQLLNFMVNCAPILDDQGNARGVLTTFDDVTQLYEKNRKLQEMLALLKEAQYKVEVKNQELEVLATHDPLTGALNRRAFSQDFNKYFAASLQTNNALTVMMVDIDHFKAVNDRYGHATGDEVIKMTVSNIKSCLRGDDIIGRYGGEEFSIMLPNTNIEQAQLVAGRIRERIEQGVYHISGTAHAISVTGSIGISTVAQDTAESSELLNQSDKALYAAKRKGRNCIISWHEIRQTDNDGTVQPGQHESSLVTDETDSGSDGAWVAKPVRLMPRDTSDHLTGLPNRRHFLRLLSQSCEQAVNTGRMLALLLLDLDMFKRINESFGHAAGDRVLKEVSLRLGKVLRSSDYVTRINDDEDVNAISRLGGDEFGIMLTGIDDIETVTQIVLRVIEALSSQFTINGHSIYITTSIGISLCPQHGVSAQTLFRDADIAMYQAKRDGRNNYRFFSSNMQKTTFEQLQLEGLLRDAIANDEFMLHYQPSVDLKTGKVTRLEALIRWVQPQRGIIGPADFIPVAEYTGLIEPIGVWVLRNACLQAKQWVDAGYDSLRVAVNLSARQFCNERLAAQIIAIVEETGLPATNLDIEITESTIMQDVELACRTMHTLHEYGIGIAIDDFGTGYSSLSYLKNFSISCLKIDRVFVSRAKEGDKDFAIINAVIALGHAMGLYVIAEGVETSEQLDLLSKLGCDEVQGYLFSPPVSATNATQMLAVGKTLKMPDVAPEVLEMKEATVINS